MKLRTFITIIFILSSVYSLCIENDMETLAIQPSVVASKTNDEIPHSAIRLRILANSDRLQDQWVKRKVRDQIVLEIKKWATQPANIQEARKDIRQKLPLFEQIAVQTLHRYGFTYPVKVDFGQVPFPTKLYGSKVYPAGNYEALRITLGNGKGDNWWCVLFPPLCFVDMSNGDAVESKSTSPLATTITEPAPVYAAGAHDNTPKVEKSEPKPKVEVRFFLLEKLTEIF